MPCLRCRFLRVVLESSKDMFHAGFGAWVEFTNNPACVGAFVFVNFGKRSFVVESGGKNTLRFCCAQFLSACHFHSSLIARPRTRHDEFIDLKGLASLTTVPEIAAPHPAFGSSCSLEEFSIQRFLVPLSEYKRISRKEAQDGCHSNRLPNRGITTGAI